MFEGDLAELDTATLLSVGAEFRALEDHAAVRQLEVALAFADRCPNPAADADYGAGFGEQAPGTERGRVYGGDGCPAVAEFAAAELGAVFGWPTGTAVSFIGEAQALRHRLPRIWAAVLAGQAVPWRARQVAHACRALSQDAAAIVDKRVVGIVNSVGWGRLKTIVKAAIFEADPAAARAAAEAAARERGVFVGESDEHGTKTIWVKAAAGDVIRFDATIDDLARALKILGDTDSLDLRRAKAVGWIADPASAHQLLEAARFLATTRNHTTTDDDTDGPSTDGASSDGARADGGRAQGSGTEGAGTDGAGTTRSDPAGRHSGGNQAGGDSGGNQAGGAGDQNHGRRDTGADPGAADTDPAAPHSTQPRPADAADTADADPADADAAADPAGPVEETRLAAEDCGAQPCATAPLAPQPSPSETGRAGTQDAEDGESGEERTGDAAERAGDRAADLPADLSADLPADAAADWVLAEAPGPDDEADRDTPHPSGSDHLDYLDALHTADLLDATAILAWRHGPRHDEPDADPGAGAATSETGAEAGRAGAGPGVDAETAAGASPGAGPRAGAEADAGADAPDAFSRQALAGKLAAIRQAAYSHGLGATTGGGGGAGGAGAGRGRGGSTLYLHLTDKTLATGEGVMRVEGAGPFLVDQLAELVGHGQIIVKPVIDLNDRVSVDSYEIPDRIRERVKLMDPVDQFPFGTTETTLRTDLDHIEPYTTTGPPGQTSTDNLAPESRFHHRVKTHGRWTVRRLPGRALKWTSPHGFKWRVDHTGTHRIDKGDDDAG